MHIVNGRKLTRYGLILTLPILCFISIHEVLAADLEKGVKAATEPLIKVLNTDYGMLLACGLAAGGLLQAGRKKNNEQSKPKHKITDNNLTKKEENYK